MRKDTSPTVSPDDKPPLPAIPLDSNIVGIDWTVNEVTFVWNQVLNILSSVNSIKDPVIHAEGIQALSDVIEILQQAEEQISTSEYKKMEHKPLNLVNIFGKSLFEATFLPATYITGKSLAIGTLCRLIVRHHKEILPLEFLSHFYGVLQQCLKNHPNSVVSHSILLNSSNIFNLALPGSSMLIPHFINEIKAIQSNSDNVLASIKQRCIIITCSLICYPKHLDGISCSNDIFASSGAEYDYSSVLKNDLLNILIKFTTTEKVSDHVGMCIWGLCTMIFEELFNENAE